MNLSIHNRVNDLRALIKSFLDTRCNDKIAAIKAYDDDLESSSQQKEKLRQQFAPATWLEDAARRAGQIQAVTHSLKPVHPDAKGTSLYCPADTFVVIELVGSHCLGEDFADDVVGNAAALDVYKFLKQQHEGRSLLELAVANDADFAAALSDKPEQAQAWMQAFASLTAPRGRLASHTLAKQLYWQTGDDPNDNASFHLLAPLYASSLAHRVFETLQDDRFSNAAKSAREARKTNTFSKRPVHEYPQLAVQQLGGTKPQNISQLNSERRGKNCLLASLPPVWRSVDLKPLINTESMFNRYSRRPEVRQNLKALLAFLKTDPKRNMETRKQRGAYVDRLIDEFLQFTAELRSLEPGWSQTSACQLSDAEARWLDPYGAAARDAELDCRAPADIDERISAAFANWLNAQLRGPLPTGDAEFLQWRKEMREQIKAEVREASHAD